MLAEFVCPASWAVTWDICPISAKGQTTQRLGSSSSSRFFFCDQWQPVATLKCDQGQLTNFSHRHRACDVWQLNNLKWYSISERLFPDVQSVNKYSLYCITTFAEAGVWSGVVDVTWHHVTVAGFPSQKPVAASARLQQAPLDIQYNRYIVRIFLWSWKENKSFLLDYHTFYVIYLEYTTWRSAAQVLNFLSWAKSHLGQTCWPGLWLVASGRSQHITEHCIQTQAAKKTHPRLVELVIYHDKESDKRHSTRTCSIVHVRVKANSDDGSLFVLSTK